MSKAKYMCVAMWMCVCCTLLCLRKAHPPGSACVYTLQGCILRQTLAWSLHLTAQASWLLELLSPVGKRKQKGAKVAHLKGFQIQKAKVFRAQQLTALKNVVLSLLWLTNIFDGHEFFIPLFFSLLWWRKNTLIVMNTGTTCLRHECSTEFSRAQWLNTALP